MRLRRSKALHETVELNITAFLNLMVILVPFLLVTAVFSRMTVLELTLPPLKSENAVDEKVDLQLQMLLYPNALEIRDATLGRIRQFTLENDRIDWPRVREVLLAVKQRFPEETTVTLLLDPAVPYKRLIEVMDHVRSMEIVNVTTLEEVELFPAITIGQAPALSEAEAVDIPLDALKSEAGQP